MLTSKYLRFFSASIRKVMESKVIVYNKEFEGFPNDENFKLVTEELPPLKDGQFLAEAEFISVDPYMRIYPPEVGKPMIGDQVAKIIESRNPNYPEGEYVVGEFGWRTLTIGTEQPGSFLGQRPKVLKNYGDLPRSLALGVLGMPGLAARFGLLKVLKPEKDETVVVSGAAGAVGLTVGQIAKLEGCVVVGITSSKDKGERLENEANFDRYVDYTNPHFETKLLKALQYNVDCYFDNVGGEISSAVLQRMNKNGRAVVCGAISTYNETDPKAREVQTPVKIAHVRMEGFAVTRYKKEWDKGIEENKKLVEQGKLKYFETVTEGFENTPSAFQGLFQGENFGKALVKV